MTAKVLEGYAGAAVSVREPAPQGSDQGAQYGAEGRPKHERQVLRELGLDKEEEGPVRNLILYNAALRLRVADENTLLPDHLERARAALDSGTALALLDRLRRLVNASV
jgi:anthranilate phosphoribosyltransferase